MVGAPNPPPRYQHTSTYLGRYAVRTQLPGCAFRQAQVDSGMLPRPGPAIDKNVELAVTGPSLPSSGIWHSTK